MKRSLILAGIALVVAAGVLRAFRPSDRVKETYRQLRLGMSLKEAEQMMGGPGTDGNLFEIMLRKLARDEAIPDLSSTNIVETDDTKTGVKQVTWLGNLGFLSVILDEKDIVVQKRYQGYQGWQQPSFMSRLRTWLGL
jgi:hypothetical protein